MQRSNSGRRRFLRDAGWSAAAVLAGADARSSPSPGSAPPPRSEVPPLDEFPRLEFVYAASVDIGALEDVGETLAGRQRLIPITGGSFEGPRLRGKVLPGAADWNLQRNDGMTVVSASYFMQTDDGTYLKIVNEGVNPRAGATPSARPRFTRPTFEAPKGRYDWLNQSVFVGTLTPLNKASVLIRVFKLV